MRGSYHPTRLRQKRAHTRVLLFHLELKCVLNYTRLCVCVLQKDTQGAIVIKACARVPVTHCSSFTWQVLLLRPAPCSSYVCATFFLFFHMLACVRRCRYTGKKAEVSFFGYMCTLSLILHTFSLSLFTLFSLLAFVRLEYMYTTLQR